MPEDPELPQYRTYRSRPRLLRRGRAGDSPADELRRLRGEPASPPNEVHRRGRPRLPGTRRLSGRRVLAWVLTAALAWVALSAVLFLVSAQLRQDDVSASAEAALDDGGYPLTTPTTILVLGSDARTEETAEPGSQVGGPSRSDSILLVRVGGGQSARLSIPRDTVVDVPGHGQAKINAAFAIGGPALAITTVKRFLGIDVNHVVEVDFANFPELIDALGGIDIRTGCVISRINGGFRNGGYTLRLKGGESHIDGRQALALARTRKNECNPREDDLTRARRQQKILAAIRDRVTSPTTFLRLPWVAWEAPKAVRSDMAGPTLIGVLAAMLTSGEPETRLLRPSGRVTLPDGGAGLVVSDSERQAAVDRFLRG